MAKYIVTPLAGEWIAGRRSPGEGRVMNLDSREAEHELRIGALREWGEPVDAYKARAEAATAPDPQPEPAPGAAKAEKPVIGANITPGGKSKR